MPVVLIAFAAWLALDVLLLGGWLAVAARRRRLEVRAMVRSAERYANFARSRRRQLTPR
jgi:hypothetical protein